MSPAQSLKESGLKATLPRRKILELFESTKVRHLSAEDVYKALIAEGIDIGLATVYPVLTQFEHAGLLSRQLLETSGAIEALQADFQPGRFRHRPLRIGARRHLRQMRDAEHLALLAQALERPTDGLRHRAADAGIDFVEHQRADRRGLRRHQLDGEAHARELAARGDFGEWAQRQARMRCHLEFDRPGALRR